MTPCSVLLAVNPQLRKNTFTNRPNADHPRYHRLSTAVPSSETKEVLNPLVSLLQSVEVSVISFLPHSFVRAWGTTAFSSLFVPLVRRSLGAILSRRVESRRPESNLVDQAVASTRDMPINLCLPCVGQNELQGYKPP